MELLVATAIGALTASGVYLILRLRSFPVVIGTAMLSYAVNTFLFATGRLAVNQPPILGASAAGVVDPIPQALVLTAIVISFGMTALIVMLMLRAYLETSDDAVNLDPEDRP
ncbi:Na+/H+ antiporter subunit C [Rubrimonas cliftonensis]|uniref:Multisubunit potassium/proton antiporter, PhaC subunit n=1 Tax=Rubrimonas cliftonensis TaxID=89524 RepID=A0A1H3WLB4_9RHOB|nr:Na+/H+ antiporter subunit C [Rubrimonas cliftonensis]SDZ87915.1 multisubunit potassium/proton antiporter, PhaC subunit [Rubrimonas cliftonensis]